MSTDRSIGLKLFCCEEGFRMWQFQLKVGMPCLILWKCVYIFPLRQKKEANFKAIFLNHKARLHNNQASSTILNNVQGRASLWNHLELSYLSCLFFVFVSSFFWGGGGAGGRTNYSFTILSLFYFNAKRVLPWFCPGTPMYFVQLVLFICCGKFAPILSRENMHLFLFVFAFLCPPFPWQSLTTVSVCYFDFAFWDFPRLNQFSRDRRGMTLQRARCDRLRYWQPHSQALSPLPPLLRGWSRDRLCHTLHHGRVKENFMSKWVSCWEDMRFMPCSLVAYYLFTSPVTKENQIQLFRQSLSLKSITAYATMNIGVSF